jgi:hypothetical protein
MNPLNLPLAAIASCALAACEKPEIVRYEIPKEKARPVLSGEPSSAAEGSGAQSAAIPEWTAPPGWEEGPSSASRIGSYTAKGSAGDAVDISVTSFPGDVGGEEANLSRWRGQVGIQGEAPPVVPETVQAGPLEGKLYDLSGPLARTLICWFRHDGSSWFFKMTGDSAAVEEHKAGFAAWIQSVRFAGKEP